MKRKKITCEIRHEAAHYNPVCACMIPESYTAYITIGDDMQPKWPCGSTYEEAKTNVIREYGPNVDFS